jgi:hypothetical protein
MPTAQGHIIIVQEQRFRLETTGGQVLLLTLAHNAPISHQGLTRLRDSGALVRVTYTGDPNTASATAQSVELS